jgi:hypothetical protein
LIKKTRLSHLKIYNNDHHKIIKDAKDGKKKISGGST